MFVKFLPTVSPPPPRAGDLARLLDSFCTPIERDFRLENEFSQCLSTLENLLELVKMLFV